MTVATLLWIVRVVAVIALLCVSAVLSTPKGRLPLALRGVYRIMKRDQGRGDGDASAQGEKVSARRRFFALFAAIIAIILAVV